MVRWFSYGVFCPLLRLHGHREPRLGFGAGHSGGPNEVWSYGKQAEPILEKYLRLRYQLMPYIYSLGYSAHQTGAPFMRGLFMVRQTEPIGPVIDSLVLIWSASESEEWENQVCFLPL